MHDLTAVATVFKLFSDPDVSVVFNTQNVMDKHAMDKNVFSNFINILKNSSHFKLL